MDKPQFVHDTCDECQFLGTYNGFDLYVCLIAKCFVKRFGDKEHQYHSVRLYRLDPNELDDHFKMAYMLARIRGITHG